MGNIVLNAVINLLFIPLAWVFISHIQLPLIITCTVFVTSMFARSVKRSMFDAVRVERQKLLFERSAL